MSAIGSFSEQLGMIAAAVMTPITAQTQAPMIVLIFLPMCLLFDDQFRIYVVDGNGSELLQDTLS